MVDYTLAGSDSKDALFGTFSDDAIYAFAENDWVMALEGHDLVFGGSGNDALSGDGGNDTLYGELGDDSLDGGAGNDSLIGGEGQDTLTGGAGADLLTGGSRADVFRVGAFRTDPTELIGSTLTPDDLAETGPDRIIDFDASTGDKINVTVSVAQAIYDGLITIPSEIVPYLTFVEVSALPPELLTPQTPETGLPVPPETGLPLDYQGSGLVLNLSSLGGDVEVLALLDNTVTADLMQVKSSIIQYEVPLI
jgi:hypothetical protein